MDYEKMLEEAYSQLPTEVSEGKRFEIPRPNCTVYGPRTVLHNFKDICDVLNRDQLHVLRFLSKEMATAATIDGSRAIFQGRFDRETFTHLTKRYVNDFVMCPVCKRPDTKIVKEKRLYFLICDACGARSSTRPV
nr:translation initiation factor IF-2 subunit beta [Candidatus Njordarchaeum guaymaensis]